MHLCKITNIICNFNNLDVIESISLTIHYNVYINIFFSFFYRALFMEYFSVFLN